MTLIFSTVLLCLLRSSTNNFYQNYILCRRWKELAKKGKEKQIPLKDDDKQRVEDLTDNLKKAIKLKENAKTTENKLLAAAAVEEAKSAVKVVRTFTPSLIH